MENIRKTVLFKAYSDSNAKIVNFHGWSLPVYFSSIKEETINTRRNISLFDASHMGEFIIEGPEAESFVNYIITNSTVNLPDYKIVYSPVCNNNGGIIDDLLVYKYNSNKFLLVVNASNIVKDWNWLLNHSKNYKVNLNDVSDEFSLIAVQGPQSVSLMKEFVRDADSLKYYTFIETKFKNIDIILSGTGYTGEKGFEILVNNSNAVEIWNTLLENGKKYKILPAGLGARDVLRIEAGYPLYGNDLSEDINPFEAGIGWTVKFNKEFIGRESLESLRDNIKRKRFGIIMETNRVPRQDNEIFCNEEKIGYITSGTYSFNLNKSIGMGFIDKNYLDKEKIDVRIHQKDYKGRLVTLPFINNIRR